MEMADGGRIGTLGRWGHREYGKGAGMADSGEMLSAGNMAAGGIWRMGGDMRRRRKERRGGEQTPGYGGR